MEGIIKIQDYKIHCVLGAHAYEREEEQEIALDIEFKIDMTECTQTDSIVDTVDYTQVAKVCRDLAQARRYHLLETFAFEAVHALMDTFSLHWVRVRVIKKNGPPLASAAAVELELSR